MRISSYTSASYFIPSFEAVHRAFLFRVDSLNVRDDTEIDWKTLPDPGWNFWSAHSLQRRWLTLKRSIKGFEEMTHTGQFLQILCLSFHPLYLTCLSFDLYRNHGHPEAQKGAIAGSPHYCHEEEEDH